MTQVLEQTTESKQEVFTAKIERLKAIKETMSALSTEKELIENNLPEKVIYQNEDGTWTRFSKIDNLKELEEKGSIFRASITNRYTTKLENLKNKPKDEA